MWITGTDTCSWQFSQSFHFFLSRELESPRTQCHAVCHTHGCCGFAAWVTYSASLGLSAQACVLTPSPCRTSLMIALVCGLYGFPASKFSCLLKLFISVHPDPNLQFPLRISIWEEGDELWQFPSYLVWTVCSTTTVEVLLCGQNGGGDREIRRNFQSQGTITCIVDFLQFWG